MSNDIVERLFNWQDDTVVMEIRQTAEDIQKLMAEGADEIERLRARLAEAETLLKKAEQNELLMVEKIDSAEALLREAREMIDRNMNHYMNMPPAGLVNCIDTFLERNP